MGSEKAVILGATSAVGQAIARRLATEKVALVLVARDVNKLESVIADISARAGITPQGIVADLADVSTHSDLIDSCHDASSFWVLYGTLPDQELCEEDFSAATDALNTNFLSMASLLTHIANLLQPRGTGSIVVVSSVAGDRGRKSNYVYGSAKGALSIFCAGLRNRLHASHINLLTVKPGFIDTPMTANIEKKPGFLWVGPDVVARDVIHAWKRGKSVLYTPWFWQFIMLIIRLVPEPIFKRLNL